MRLRHKKLLVPTRGTAILRANSKMTGKQARRMLRADRAEMRNGRMTYGPSKARLRAAIATAFGA